MKKTALFVTTVFFALSLFAPTKTFAVKKDDKKAPPKTEQVKAVKAESAKPAAKAAVKAAEKPVAKPVAKPAVTTAAPTKKDGTPDMRFKANKEAAKPAGPTKKDGTPDMRYKANQK
ncbi:hypothetical protein [Chlorobium sp. KB01]|uniref:hypothetical protein n=1 Tax=Chlorobium sp. KB01 TaxID=1917528 RepID=UPI00097816F5|nr:hypothetical protein [Chlorobium sp. KB01]